MLIQLASGKYINPDLIEYMLEYCQDEDKPVKWVSGAQIGSRMFDLTQEDWAKVMAYHTKAVVVDGIPDFVGREEFLRGLPSSAVLLDDAGGFDQSKRTTKPFTVQDLPKVERSPEMQRIHDLASEHIASVERHCSECVNLNTKECAGCIDIDVFRLISKNFSKKKPPSDCSGTQHEKRCHGCRFSGRSAMDYPCRECFEATDHINWTPRA